MRKDKKKSLGQIYTPQYLVREILDYCHYYNNSIVGKHVIDNSCGDGAFLKEIVNRYCYSALRVGKTNEEIKIDLETFIHGIDTDEKACNECVKNLNKCASEYGIRGVKWDIINGNSLAVSDYDYKMDFVIGNPPYVRNHNLTDDYEYINDFRFTQDGMTDLYLAFFELGFRMLSNNGVLGYITPSSWLSSVAGGNMRKYILKNKNLTDIIDLEHFQAFDDATVYTAISIFTKKEQNENFNYYIFSQKQLTRNFVETLSLNDCCIDGCFYLGRKQDLKILREIKTAKVNKYVSAKNGYATLADNVFIGENIPDSKITINIYKGGNGKWSKCLYPYDQYGNLLSKEDVFSDEVVKSYFFSHRDEILKGKEETIGWYGFGRTQGLKDTYKEKLGINTLCRKKEDLKTELIHSGEGIYSGLYIITNFNISLNLIKDILISDEFVNYIKMLKKYKSGGYYTFSSKDAEQYINWFLTCKYNYNIEQKANKQQLTLF